jgi:hypothetical protein
VAGFIAVVPSVFAIGLLAWFALSSVGRGLVWDDVNAFLAFHDFEHFPFNPVQWGEVLAHHPPTQYLPQFLLWQLLGRRYSIGAHLLQSVLVCALLLFCYRQGTRAMGRLAGLVFVGLIASWPMVGVDVQGTTPDLFVGLCGFAALNFLDRGRRAAGLACYAVGCLTKITAVAFLPALWLMASTSRDRRRTRTALAAITSIPILWVLFGIARGAPSRVAAAGPITLLRNAPIHARRHAFELFIWDGRWVVSVLAAVSVLVLVALARHGKRRELIDNSLNRAASLAFISLFAMVCVATPGSLSRYLLVGVPLIAWLLTNLFLRVPQPLGFLLAGGAVAVGCVASLSPLKGARGDNNPTLLREWVDSRQHLIDEVVQARPSGAVGAPWPITVYLRQPAAGFVEQPLEVGNWLPNEPGHRASPCQFSLLWVDGSRTPDIATAITSWIVPMWTVAGTAPASVGKPRTPNC